MYSPSTAGRAAAEKAFGAPVGRIRVVTPPVPPALQPPHRLRANAHDERVATLEAASPRPPSRRKYNDRAYVFVLRAEFAQTRLPRAAT